MTGPVSPLWDDTDVAAAIAAYWKATYHDGVDEDQIVRITLAAVAPRIAARAAAQELRRVADTFAARGGQGMTIVVNGAEVAGILLVRADELEEK